MEINTDYNLVKKTLENIDKIVSIIDNPNINNENYKQLLIDLSQNNKITKDVIDFYNLDKIKYFKLELNPNFEINWIKEYPDKNWNFEILSQHPNLSFDWIKEYPNKNWDLYSLIKREEFTTEYIELYPNKNWGQILDYYNNNYIITNSNLKEFIKNNKMESYEKMFYYYLAKHKNFNINWVIQFPNKPWDITRLKNDPNLTFEWIENSLKQKWEFNTLHLHPKFNFNWVLKKPNLSWNYKQLHLDKNFKFEWIKKLPNKDWNFYYIKPELIDINFVKKYPDKNWNMLNIIKHPKFTKDLLKTTNILFKINYEILNNNYFNPKWFEEYKYIKFNYNVIQKVNNFNVQWVLNYYNKWPYIYNHNNYKNSYNKEKLKNEKNFTILNFDKDFDIEWLKKYPEKKWNYDIICLHPNFKIEWVNVYPILRHNISYICWNPNFQIEWVKILSQTNSFYEIFYYANHNKNFKLDWLTNKFINIKLIDYNYIINNYLKTKETVYKFLEIINNINNFKICFDNNSKNKINLKKLITIEMLLKFDKIIFTNLLKN